MRMLILLTLALVTMVLTYIMAEKMCDCHIRFDTWSVLYIAVSISCALYYKLHTFLYKTSDKRRIKKTSRP